MHITLIVITLVSTTLAAIMSVVTWRLMREERRRSAARVAALAAEIHDEAGTIRRFDDELELGQASIPGGRSNLFAATDTAASPASRFAAVVALGIFVVGTGAALAVVLSSSSRGSANSATPRAPVASGSTQILRADASSQTAPVEPLPLELVALGHERDADRLTIRGVVRNPPSGAEKSGLTAVVFLFDHAGGFSSSGRAAIDLSTLAPGAESSFVVTIPGAVDVGRYRVSFRTDDGVVPHVDRRQAKLDVRR